MSQPPTPDGMSDALSAVPGSTDKAQALVISDSLGNARVILGKLPSGDYGLKVIGADGSTVIIDGTSDMFKIVATGTLSKATNTGDNSVISETTLAGLGTLAAPPAHIAYLGLSNVGTNSGRGTLGSYIALNAIGWVAGSSGGSPTNPAVTPTIIGELHTYLNGSSNAVLQLRVTNANAGAQTMYCTYYVLFEADL